MEELGFLSSGVMVISVIIAVWVITSKQFRKSVGSSVSDVIVTNCKNVAEGAKRSTVLDELEFLEELKDLGHASSSSVVEARKSYKSIMQGV